MKSLGERTLGNVEQRETRNAMRWQRFKDLQQVGDLRQFLISRPLNCPFFLNN